MEVKVFLCLFLVMLCNMWDLSSQFPNQGSNLRPLHWKQSLNHLTKEVP